MTVFATPAYARGETFAHRGGAQRYGDVDHRQPRGLPGHPRLRRPVKARWRRPGRGKSGGVRAIYYFWASTRELYLLFLYAKADQADLSAHDRKAARQFIEGLKKDVRQNQADD